MVNILNLLTFSKTSSQIFLKFWVLNFTHSLENIHNIKTDIKNSISSWRWFWEQIAFARWRKPLKTPYLMVSAWHDCGYSCTLVIASFLWILNSYFPSQSLIILVSWTLSVFSASSYSAVNWIFRSIEFKMFRNI